MDRFNTQFNPEVVKDLEKLDEKIKEEEGSEHVNQEKVAELKMAKLWRGMQLTMGYNNRYNGGIPY